MPAAHAAPAATSGTAAPSGTAARVTGNQLTAQLTQERRRDYIKLAKNKAEDARVSVRNIRRRAKEDLDRIARDGEAGEDEVTRAEKELEHVTKRHVDAIDDLLRHKETELLEV